MRSLSFVNQLWFIVPASRDLRVLLVFCQHLALFVSLETIEICGLLLKVPQSSFQRFPRRYYYHSL